MKSSYVLASMISLMLGVATASPTELASRQKAPGVGDPNADVSHFSTLFYCHLFRLMQAKADLHVSKCDDQFDCCYSSEAACFRQLGYGPGNIYCPLHKYCATDYNIPRTKCVSPTKENQPLSANELMLMLFSSRMPIVVLFLLAGAVDVPASK